MDEKESRKSLDERIDEQNRVRGGKTEDTLSAQTSLTGEENLSKTHDAISNQEGDGAAENKVATSLDDE